MVKGRRKGRTPYTRVTTENAKTRTGKFQGKLSYESPNGKLTAFFEASPKLTPKVGIPLQQANNIKSPHRIEMAKEAKSGKLTDYFPVRRSVRKTKGTVLEENRKRMEDAVLSGKEEGLEVRIFPGKGRGVVATKEFQRGDYVVEYAGELVSLEEARLREATYARDHTAGCYMYYFNHKDVSWCVDATRESARIGRLVNHCRSGNLMTKTITVGGLPRLVLVAKEHITPGDELTYDYGDRSKESLLYHPWLAT